MRSVRFGAPLAICLAGLAAYHNALTGPFLFDDRGAIRDNESIRSLATALRPPESAGVGGRPLLNLSYALNYAWGGLNTWGYHLGNVLIHVAAALVLFGIVRRTLESECLRKRFGRDKDWLALSVALLWVVHPLATAAVDWMSERAELMMGLFYLLGVYGWARGGRRWLAMSVIACWLGALTKEVIATAPLILLLYDRTFVAGSFAEAWRRRWRYYAALAGTWVLIGWGMYASSIAQRLQGGVAQISSLTYGLTSCRSVLLYLKLAIWPHPLVFYHGMGLVHGWGQAAPYLLGVLVLAAVGVMALIRRPSVGFLAAWVFVILAPTTSVVPLAGMPTAEHRFYLSLAGVVALGVLALYRWIGRRALAVMILAIPLGGMTLARNEVYRSELGIWADAAKKIPDDPEIRREYALVLLTAPGRLPDAIAEFQTVARMRPDVQAFTELGWAQGHARDGAAEAIATVREGLSYAPHDPLALQALGLLYLQAGRPEEAAQQFRFALRSRPHWALAEGHLADADRMLGSELMRDPARASDAMAVLREAVRLNPELTTAHTDLGWLMGHTDGGLEAGIAEVRAGLKFHPEDAYAHNTLGLLLMHAGRGREAIDEFRAAVRAKPDFEEAKRNLEHAGAGD